MKCGFCKSKIIKILDLGKTPLANSFLTKRDLKKKEKTFALTLNFCRECHLIQAPRDVKSKEIFNEKYVYFSSTSKYWTDHAQRYCKNIIKKIKLKNNSCITEVASNDGYLLKNFDKKKFKILGIEPSKNTAEYCRKKYNIRVIKDFFNLNLINKKKLYSKTDLLIANNVLAHNPNINNFVLSIKRTLSVDGVATIEFPHFYNLLKDFQFDTIYHEHFYYFSLRTLIKIFKQYDLKIWDVDEIDTHGGSLRIYVSHFENNRVIKQSVKSVLKKELNSKLFNLETLKNFSKKVEMIKKNTQNFINLNLEKNKKIAFYGAAAKGNTFLNYLNIKAQKINHIFDLSNVKVGKYLPGSKIEVFHPSKDELKKFDIIIILPWNLKKEITKQLSRFTNKKCEFFICIPKMIKTN